MSFLKPGERAIMNSLKEGEKRFKDLNEACVTNPNVLSAYLKNLQKQGLIIRDVDTRKFQLLRGGWEALYLAEIHDLIGAYGLKKASFKLWGFEVIVSEHTGMLKRVDETLTSGTQNIGHVYLCFSRINRFLFYTWKGFVLASLNEKERETIRTYERVLGKATSLLVPREGSVNGESSRSQAEQKLKRRYPGAEIPEGIIRLEAERIRKKMEVASKRAVMLELGNIHKVIQSLARTSVLRGENQVELNDLAKHLEDSENAGVYERYLERLRECPKTLIIFSSTGFGGYINKYWQFFPDEEKAFKKKHPWLYANIRENTG